MLTVDRLDLQADLQNLEVSEGAMDRFVLRAAAIIEEELVAAGVEYHAVNDYDRMVNQDGFDKVAHLQIWSDGKVIQSRAYDTLANPGRFEGRVPCMTSACDSELHRVFKEFVGWISAQSKRVVFADLYCPKSATVARQCNNLRVAFRFVSTWDPVHSGAMVRFDCLFKDLNG
jgi:hypothetical protein